MLKFSRLEIPHINSPVGTPRRYMLPIGTPGALQQIFLEIMGGAHQALMHARLSLTKRLNVPDHARVVHSIRKNVASVLDRLGNRCDHVRVADQNKSSSIFYRLMLLIVLSIPPKNISDPVWHTAVT